MENEDLANPDLTFFRKNLQRLDPANKSLCFAGFDTENGDARKSVIENFFRDQLHNAKINNIEHIYQGIAGNRKLTSVTIVEVTSRAAREDILTSISNENKICKTSNGKSIQILRAKTSQQLERNGNLKKALAAVKRSPLSAGKAWEIKWKIEGSKNRAIAFGEEVAFLQTPDR